MTTIRFITACCAAVFMRCATTGPDRPPAESSPLPVVSSPAFAGMIVPRAVNFPDSWTPTEEEVVLAEPKVQQCVLSQYRGLRSTLTRFYRHYSGSTVDGRRTLRVQFFDTHHFRAEKLSHPMEVCDGDGETYFVISFDLESATCLF